MGGLLDAEDLGAGLLVPVERLEHPAGQVEQALAGVLLAEADWPVAHGRPAGLLRGHSRVEGVGD